MLVRELGEFVAGTKYEDIPENAREAARLRILDTLGAALAGYHLGLHRPLVEVVRSAGGSMVWGEGCRYGIRDATMVNSFLAHCCYIDDGSRHTGGHPSSVVIPAAMALAESRNASGRDLIAAVVAGYEIFLRLGRAVYPSIVRRGFQSTAVLGAISSAAASASLLNLDAVSAQHALAIAGNLGVGLKEALKCSSSQPLQVGRSCESGLLGAQFAAAGARGAETIIENGFFPAFAGDNADPSALLGLGSGFQITETYVKIHGGCRGNHAPVDAVRMLVENAGIKPDDIARIDVFVDTVTHAGEIEEPRNGAQAQFSVAFSVAVAIIEGNASVFQFTDAKLSRPDIRDLMKRIVVTTDPALDKGYPDKRGTRIEIVLENGKRHSQALENARGEPEAPLSGKEIEDKFMTIGGTVLGPGSALIRDRIMALEAEADIGDLVRMLARDPAAETMAAPGPPRRG